MLFQQLREQRYINREIKINVEELINQLKTIRGKTEILLIVGKPSGNNYRGMFNGAMAWFPESTFAFPHYFSRNIYSEIELKSFFEAVVQLKFSKVIFKGYPPFFKELILSFNKVKKNSNVLVDTFITYHGSFSTNREDSFTSHQLKEIITLLKDGYVKKIGFVKKGMAETYSKVANISSSFLLNKTIIPEETTKVKTIDYNKINIGVFTHSLYRKNIDNQVAAALMMDDALVHVKDGINYDYLFSKDRIVEYGFFDSFNDFSKLVGSMDLNFYVTFSECFGLFITESLAKGVPCLAADNSGLFDYDDELHELLIVKEFDNSNAIYKQALIALENRDKIISLGKNYVKKLNGVADKKLKDFLYN